MTNSSFRFDGAGAPLALAALAACVAVAAPLWPMVAAGGAGALALTRRRAAPEAAAAEPVVEDALRDAVARVTTLLDGAFHGDLESRLAPVPVAEPGRRLAIAANDLLDVVDAFARESHVSVEMVASGRYHRRFLARGLDGAFARAANVITDGTQRMGARHRHFTDLTNAFEADVMAVARRLDGAAGKLGDDAAVMVGAMGQAGEDTRRIDDEAEASSSAAAAVQATGAALDAALKGLVESAGRAKALGDDAVSAVAGSRESVANLLEAAERIGGVVDLIKRVASQTGLLALNAMVEAARAGQAGAGFAVVAREVQELARQSQAATAEIASEIGRAQKAARATASAIDTVDGVVGGMSAETAASAEAVEREAGAVAEILSEIGALAGRAEAVSRLAGGVSSVVEEAHGKSEAVGAEASDVLAQVRRLGARLDTYLAQARAA
jgi:methyl-accepting chemotaxis protein